MWIVELIMDIVDLILDIWFGMRYGFGSFWWEVGAGICTFAVIFACIGELYILAAIAGAGAIVCTVFSIRCFYRDIKKHRQKAKEVKRSSPSPEDGEQ